MSDKDITKMSAAQLEARLEDLAALAERYGAREEMGDDDVAAFEQVRSDFHAVKTALEIAKRDEALEEIKRIRKNIDSGATRRETIAARAHDLDDDPAGEPRSLDDEWRGRNPHDLSEMRTFGRSQESVVQELRSRAYTAIEKMRGTNDLSRQRMTEVIEQFDDNKGTIAKMALVTGSPTYMRAFFKQAAALGRAQLNDDELRAVEAMRAMSLTDSAGGYLVPFQLDPSVIITSAGSLNQFRQASKVVVATGDVWNGVSAGATSWSWDAEAAEVSDDTSTFAQPSVPIYKGAGFIPISIEAYQDEANVTAEVGRLLAFGKTTLESTAHATGAGSTQPTGIITALTGGASVVASATTDTFAIADVYALDGALPARYRPTASWFANRKVYNLVRQFDTAGGAGLWERLGADVPPLLLGRSAYESEAMDGVINATQDNLILVYGDFANSFVIADRVGMTVEFIPHLFHTDNNRPSGQRGWYAYFRQGADSVNDGAFRLLNVT